nr:DUF5906 domain-containing protein [uncultured Cohaesibacter sp.]
MKSHLIVIKGSPLKKLQKLANALNRTSSSEAIISVMQELALKTTNGLICADNAHLVLESIAKNTSLPLSFASGDFDVMCRMVRFSVSGKLHMEIAQQIVHQKFGGGCYLWHDPDGKLWEYNGYHWAEISKDQLKQIVFDAMLTEPAWLQLCDEKETKLIVKLILNGSLRKTSLSETSSIKGFVLNDINGELWRSGPGIELRPHRPWSGQFSALDVGYDPKAVCPMYDTALGEIFSKSSNVNEMVRHLNEFAGYAIQSSRPVPTFWLLIGKGANGKSKLLDLLVKFIGQDGVLAEPISRFQNDSFAPSSLEGKKLLLDDDVTEDLMLDDGLIKKLSEEKFMSARRPYGHQKKTFISFALPVMAGNHCPSSNALGLMCVVMTGGFSSLVSAI